MALVILRDGRLAVGQRSTPTPCLPCHGASLTTASVSPPAWDSVNFLKATTDGKQTVYGVLGKCVKGGSCTSKNVGYDLGIDGAE